MKIKLLFLLVFLIAICKSKAQTNKDSLVYEYAILRHERRITENHLDVTFSNNQYIDLRKELKEENKSTIPYSEYQDIFRGINYLTKRGYELVSSNSYGTTYPLREYLFRKKK